MAIHANQTGAKAGGRNRLPESRERSGAGRVVAATRGAGSRLGAVDFLRCVAGTAVLWHHISHSSKIPSVAASGAIGWVGVEIFFVVSGFIIPFAMHGAGYQFPGDAKRFVARRLVRLDPPYFLASALAALLSYAAWRTPGFRGPEPAISWAATLAHVGYLNGILELPWYNPVCWTLGVEFQFYLIAAILFPVFAGSARLFLPFAALSVAVAVFVAKWCGYGSVSPCPWLLRWWPIFLLGISAYRVRIGAANKREFSVVQLLATTAAITVGRWEGAIAGALSAPIVAFVNANLPRLLAAYAAITYSLYLVHVPVGARVVHLMQRLGSAESIDGMAIVSGIAASLFAATVFWHYVESPSLKWAARLQPNKSQR